VSVRNAKLRGRVRDLRCEAETIDGRVTLVTDLAADKVLKGVDILVEAVTLLVTCMVGGGKENLTVVVVLKVHDRRFVSHDTE